MTDRVTRRPDETISYGAFADQVYDVRLPRVPALGALVIVVHGGFWKPAYDRSHAAAQAEGFAEAGFHVAVPEYRRARRAGWPHLAADLRAALATIRSHPHLPERAVLVGHSAGGQLVAWALHQRIAAGLAGAVSLGGCLDLALCRELDLGNGAVEALFGGPTPADADPLLLGAAPAPVIALHGDRDEQVPVEVSRSYHRAVPGSTLRELPGVDHYAPIDPRTEAFVTSLDAVRSLLAI
ncbi:alpha/beta hydrolase fold domain-containing protein [Calidifontibacter sp. DB0510]|uniref:Alpha/beta hydrolase fold domain-containing protein n=1 Tax=Metallococcus carri TaxID=1656884 RepID=A0A967B2L5_9MICO|nr:alpha/beta hydrolase [Metallococcus carri]NHN56829.1 alpha/beta hydrolase fold domain-containing protein [Metallococcus carri]NOP37794.1 alpha/beta hydrolase fold domain-containing protein [Calidifontibacter sp. DB2511S]